MNRRGFFSIFTGTAAIVAAPAAQLRPEPKYQTLEIATCKCGNAMMAHGHFRETQFFTCTRKECDQYDIPLQAPRMQRERVRNFGLLLNVWREEKMEAERRLLIWLAQVAHPRSLINDLHCMPASQLREIAMKHPDYAAEQAKFCQDWEAYRRRLLRHEVVHLPSDRGT